jgi:Tol biopolymer transport system component/DNA-binding winged helix-turn-helix (wHTH) protein
MSNRQKHLYEFGRFALDASNRLLFRDGEPVPLHPKAFDTLLLLIEHRDEVLGKDDLMQALWPDSFVEESNLSQNIYVLRKALGQEAEGPEFIKTVPKRGYKFVAGVTEVGGEETELIVEEQTRTHIVTEEEIDDVRGGAVRPSADRSWPLTDGDGEAGGQSVQSPARETLSRPASGVAAHTGGAARRRRTLALSLAALVTVAAAGFGLYKFMSRRGPAEGFRRMKISRLTFTGKVSETAISPDGRYVAYVLHEAEQQSLWVRQLATASTLQIVQAPEARLAELVFSPDGNFVYYLLSGKGQPHHTLQRVPVIGGPSKKLVEDVWTPVTFSPDGGRFAFVRRSPSRGEDSLVVANADGGGEQIIASRKRPDFFLTGAAWSPDGKVIACAGGSFTGGLYHSVIEVRADDGSQKPLTDRKWARVDHLAWLPDGGGLVITATERGDTSHQLWRVSYPGGAVERITNDLNEYHGVSLTADARTLVTAQTETLSNLWVTDGGDARSAVQITTGPGGDGIKGVSWTPGGKIVYASGSSGNLDIWLAGADGTGRRQLTSEKGRDMEPSVSPDGRFVVFVSDRTGNSQVWRMGIDGSDPVQLTDGFNGHVPQVSPDGRWVVYISLDAGKLSLWRVPFGGGEEAQLTDKFSILPAVSPDGKLIACHYREGPFGPLKIAVIPFDGGPPAETFDVPPSAVESPVKWTADGRALVYSVTNDGVSNLWLLPRDGGPPTQLTDFKDGSIFWFELSRDGKRLALSRGSVSADAILISDFQ